MPDRPRPIYVLHGSDHYLRTRHRRRILQQLLGDADPQLALVHLDASAELATVLDELRTLPLLAPRRVVLLSDAETFVNRHTEALKAYLDGPAPNGSLIVETGSWQQRWKLTPVVQRTGEMIECAPPPPRELPRWAAEFAAERGKKLSREAAELLALCTGSSLAQLDSEIEKLALYVGSRREIGGQDVADVVAATAGPVAFALADAIRDRDAAEALKALDDLLIRPGDEVRVLGLLAWQLRQSPTRRAARAPVRDVRRVLSTDLALKTGAQPKAALQLLVTQLCQ